MKLSGIKNIKRLVIYFFYDKDGIVDRYVPYMLEDMKKNCSELFVVCNGKLTVEGRAVLEAITPNVYVRENKGFDVWAYKAAMEQYGWKKLEKFDEVVLMNFTFYGPLYPFSEVFSEMNERDLDFWGLTKHYKIDFDPFGTTGLGYVPEHIQSSFICIRNKMLSSREFHNYWDNMGEIRDYRDAVGKHEAVFTKKFNDYGYVSDVYVQTDDLEGFSRYPLMFEAKEMIQNRKCPIFKKKMFTNEYYEYIDVSTGEAAVETYRYICENFDYDMDMFWENLLRTSNMADIKDRMHLNYPLSMTDCCDWDAYKTIKTALFMHLYFDDKIEESIHYADSMPVNSDIYFTVCNDKMEKLVTEAAKKLAPRKVKIVRIENRGRDVSSLLIGAAPYVDQYELACFAHDKKTTQVKPFSSGQSFAYRCLENVLGSKAYVRNVIAKFKSEPRMGILMPPPPYHGWFYDGIGNEWTTNFDNAVKLAEELNIRVDLNREKEPISPLGTMFWFRTKALKPLFDKKWKYEDFPKEPNACDGTILHAIERIYGPCAQSQGYYGAWGMTDQYTSIELTNYHFMARETLKALHGTVGFYGGLLGMNQHIWQHGLTQNVSSGRIAVKNALKRRIPRPIWNVSKKIYHFFGGKKWVG